MRCYLESVCNKDDWLLQECNGLVLGGMEYKYKYFFKFLKNIKKLVNSQKFENLTKSENPKIRKFSKDLKI